MFQVNSLLAKSSDILKTHKFEIYNEITYKVFILDEIFSDKGNHNKDLTTYSFIFKNENSLSQN